MNSASPIKRWQAVAILLFVVSLFGLVVWKQNDTIRDLDKWVYEACLIRVSNIQLSNDRNAALAEIERQNPYQYEGPLEKATVERRIELFSQKLTPPDCGEKP